MKNFVCAISLIVGLGCVAVSPAFAEGERVITLDTVADELTAAKSFCMNSVHYGYWRLVDETLAELIYFCDGRYEGIWIYAAYPVSLKGSDLTEASFRTQSELLLVSSDSQGTKYIVDTSRLIFLGIGQEVKRPVYLTQQHNGDYLEYLVLLPERIVFGLDFSRGLDNK